MKQRGRDMLYKKLRR